MRRQYLSLGLRQLFRGRARSLLRAAWRTRRLRGLTRSGRPAAGPLFASLVVNYTCNLACSFCRAWHSADGAREGEPISRQDLDLALDDLAHLGCLGVGITGGEPLLRKDLGEIVEGIHRRGMLAHVNTNGTLLDGARARELISCGVDSFNVSVDSAHPDSHDALRGRKGAHDDAARGISELLSARGGRKSPRVVVVSVVDAGTDLDALMGWAADSGVDGIGFIPRHVFSDEQRSAITEDGARALKAKLLAWRSRSSFIDNSAAYLGLFDAAVLGRPHDLVCHAGAGHIVFDLHGAVYPCMPFNEADRSFGNLRATRLRDLWNSPAHREVVATTSRCRACYWNCHTEMNLLVEGRSC